jgi:RNA polymerase sigma-70 factor, ECF subfamily
MQAVDWRNGLELGARPAGLLLKVGTLHNRPTQTDLHAKSPAELARLIEAVAARQDRDAFAALFDHFAPRIKAFLMRTNISVAGAEELAQEALLIVWRKAVQFDRERAGASSWIFTIARNLRIDSARREQRGRVLDLEASEDFEPPVSPDTELLASERDQRVRAALEHLTVEQLRVVRLSFFEGKAHGDIATELELPLGTVKSRIRLAMNRLRELLGDLT